MLQLCFGRTRELPLHFVGYCTLQGGFALGKPVRVLCLPWGKGFWLTTALSLKWVPCCPLVKAEPALGTPSDAGLSHWEISQGRKRPFLG